MRGYLGEHSRTCPYPNECPLGIAMRTNKTSLSNLDKTQQAYKSFPVLVSHAERLYEYYIETYNTFSYKIIHDRCPAKASEGNIGLARFIITFSKEPTLAIRYLTQSKSLKQSLQDQFLAYRYEQLLNENCKNKAYLEEGETINVLNVMKYEKYQIEFADLVEQNGLLHMQFWSTLLDESPSMPKVCEVGFRILAINSQIMKLWTKIQNILPGNPKDLTLYASYLNQVWNDREMGSTISEKFSTFLCCCMVTKTTEKIGRRIQRIRINMQC